MTVVTNTVVLSLRNVENLVLERKMDTHVVKYAEIYVLAADRFTI